MIGTCELLHNPDFKVVKFDHFRMNAGLTSFVLSPVKWGKKTGEQKQFEWDIRKNLTKINYHIHIDTIKDNLIPFGI